MISLKNIKKSFNKNVVLDNISLNIDKGEVVVIIGSSGSGKSTLLRCINGLEEIENGEIMIDDKTLTKNKAMIRNIRKDVGMVFQHFNLFPHLKVYDNIAMGPINSLNKSKKETQND